MPLDVHEYGDGPAVMLLHGTPSPVSDYAPVIERLRNGHRVLAPYLPGYGRSPRLVPYSYRAMRDAIIEAMRARGVVEVAIVGFSLGGLHALALALDGRLRVSRLALLAPLARYTDEDRVVMRGFIEQLRLGPDLSTPPWRAIAGDRFTARTEVRDAVADWLSLTSPDVIADELEAGIAEDLRSQLPALRVPVAIRVGSNDLAAPPAYAHEIAALCPHATLEVVPGLGHAQCLEDPVGTATFVEHAIG